MNKRLEYKFIEISRVNDESLTDVVNEWVASGWEFDDVRFVMTEHSKRPAMAFVTFVRAMENEVPDELN